MTREQAGKMWPILKAYSLGKDIEVLQTTSIGAEDWVIFENPMFNAPPEYYRIKGDE